MAPKRMPKVTSLPSSSSNGGTASSSRGRNANPFGPVDPNSYNDYDEAMQDGVELEEKGERFQFGPKAQRFYIQAGTLYARAVSLAGNFVERRADALYNASRIHFLLATQFALPPENLKSLVEAITSSQEATGLAPPLPVDGSLPNPFKLDTMTQLATSTQTLAEAVQELGWPQGLESSRSIAQGPQGSISSTLLWQQAMTIFQQVADGQHVILQDQKTTENAAEPPVESSTEAAGTDADEDDMQSVNGGDDVYGYTSSLVTPASLMETLLSLLACLTSMIEAASAAGDVLTFNTAVDQVVARAQAVVTDAGSTASLPSTSNDAAQASSEVAARWQEVERSAFLARVASLSKAFELGSTPSQISSEVESTMQLANDWSSRLIASPSATKPSSGRKDAEVATLCDVGEACQNLCRLSLRLEPAEAGVAAIWALATSSSKLFSQALAALDTSAAGGGSVAVLGQANTSTPTSRARCRILLALSSLSIFRSHPGFEAAGIAGAKGTRGKLVDNARLYARKAVTEIGLGWILRPAPASASRSAALPPPGGWESLSLEAEAVFHLLRALLVRANVCAATADAKASAEMATELHSLVQHIKQLRQRPIQIGATAGTTSAQLADWLFAQGAKSFVDGVVDDNGRNIVQEEIAWWEKLFSDQLAS
ncbi:hypothetical protein PSEUBRA_000648 [Kalmanozyma brasiliensis GHG001]|uniref:Uncharacterized protein n=1 Tax=Kalmanozyma brasiliensis (strain GHG001) TaxID=1365824 RepID=V5GWG2_KALBG|nr:uncharacterized protein PSEUBRA_000648 [Kalmanozyma brasiliensis GHG001]EST10232.1 hypothetical protein PSEUBRA_000648 [Kalmanozyma brasiliensis GHG001]